MKFNAKAPESIEVDFERKIQISNPEARSTPWKKMPRRWRAVRNPCAHAARERRDCVKVI